jgi:hypothetical protein
MSALSTSVVRPHSEGAELRVNPPVCNSVDDLPMPLFVAFAAFLLILFGAQVFMGKAWI